MSKLKKHQVEINELILKTPRLPKLNDENDDDWVHGGVDFNGMIVLSKGEQQLRINEAEAKRICAFLYDITRETIFE